MDFMTIFLLQSNGYLYGVDWHRVKDMAVGTVAVCSFLHTILPPWDWDPAFVREGLSEFPVAQEFFHSAFNNRYYRLLVYTIGFIALNARSTIWRSISISNPDGLNAVRVKAAKAGQNGQFS